MYNNCSTLLYKYNPRHKKTHRIGGRSDNISILLNADSPSLITMNQLSNILYNILLLTSEVLSYTKHLIAAIPI